ncbi:MAG: gamma-butyrobetaine hydroxylase-like domain-containing protein [Gammaproteobacteria bacterium]|nr:gamma-butyrobetaine hydroxylase-like domain-containing protein [Gammaproteobacteria bacterium]
MSEKESSITPTEISLHQKSRLLELAFSDGFRFKYPCEYLRVFSTSAEVKTMTKPVHGKEMVNISSMEPQGGYALKINFDDGHNTGIYSWASLHELGVNYEKNWAKYLKDLAAHNLQRGEGRLVGVDGKVTIKLVYFIELAKLSGKNEEEVVIPDSVTNVETLLVWMRKRGGKWAELFADDRVQVTVNRQFSEPYTLIEHGDEVAFVPRPKF